MLPAPVTDVAPLLAAVVRLLATDGADAADQALALARDALGCARLTLRAGDDFGGFAPLSESARVPEQGGADRWVLDLPVRARGTLHGVLTAVADRPFTEVDGRALGALADSLALGLSSAAGALPAARAVLDAEADRAQAAADLHATVEQVLIPVRYAAERLRELHPDAGAVTEPLAAALAAVRHVHADLRAHALEAGLRVALGEIARSGRGDRPDDGRAPLAVTVVADDPALDALPSAVAVTVQRVTEAVLRGATGSAKLLATYDGEGVKLRVECADTAYDASELDRWSRRVSALGGSLRLRPGGVELDVPAPSATRRTP